MWSPQTYVDCFFWFASIIVTVGELPNPDSFGKLLLLLKSSSYFSETSSSKRAKKVSSCAVGSLFDTEVISFSFCKVIELEYFVICCNKTNCQFSDPDH